jgi:Domain of unknown function (DUF397)
MAIFQKGRLDMSNSDIKWQISSASGGTNCVEVAFVKQEVLVRDSKNRDGATLAFSKPIWREFISALSDHDKITQP